MDLFCLTYSQAEGIPKQYTLSVLVNPNERDPKTVTVKFPNGTVPGSQRVRLTVTGKSLSRNVSEDSDSRSLIKIFTGRTLATHHENTPI